MTNLNGIPGLKGVEHIGLNVPDLNEAVDFFVHVIGCEPFYEIGPMQAEGDWMQTQLNVHPRASIRKLKFLRCGNGPNFELIEYHSPDQNSTHPKNSDYGGHHLAIYVDDIDAAIAYLKSMNVQVIGEPVVRTSGPSMGQTWVYFLAPWGLQFELVSYPDGKGYENDTDARLWHPACPDNQLEE